MYLNLKKYLVKSIFQNISIFFSLLSYMTLYFYE